MALLQQRIDYLGFIYGILLIGGGVFAASKRGSRISLIAGGGSGVAALWGAMLVTQNNRDINLSIGKKYSNALVLTSGVAAMLFTLMGIRFLSTRKFMPTGLISVLSFIMIVWYYRLVAGTYREAPPIKKFAF